jgi:UDP-N-acetylglucosamine 2-epimerase (non-hydrolysing)
MPEEINRLLTDQIADLLFTSSPDADLICCAKGRSPKSTVGNVTIDTLVKMRQSAPLRAVERLGLRPRNTLWSPCTPVQ